MCIRDSTSFRRKENERTNRFDSIYQKAKPLQAAAAASAPEPEPEPETLEQELLKKRGVAFDQSDYKTFTGAEGVLSLQTVFSDVYKRQGWYCFDQS